MTEYQHAAQPAVQSHLPSAPERQGPKPPSADELGEPTLIIVVVAVLLTTVGGVWLLATVTTMWILALVMVVEIASIAAMVAVIGWQLSDGPGRRIEDQPPSPTQAGDSPPALPTTVGSRLSSPRSRRGSQERTPRPRTPTI